ncbi:MAG: GMP synthase subunit A [Candidatus Methanomethylicaceae archaeon]
MQIPVVFMGGQYNHLIVRALRELGVESSLIMPTTVLEELDVDGLVMGGGPYSVNDGLERFGNLPTIIKKGEFPMLGICLSHQLIGRILGGTVVKGRRPEYGETLIKVVDPDELFQGVGSEFVAWASHNDEVRVDGGRFRVLAKSDYCEVEALRHEARPIYGVQFHVEVAETPMGSKILKNFVMLCK